MPLRTYKPTSPGLRQMTRSTFEEITTREPHKPLLEPQTRGSGRNNAGRITGYTTPWRKAIVTLAPGQKIEFFEGV